MQQYTRFEAETYAMLGVEGTTYESGLKTLIEEVRDATGNCIDVGCGTGRVTKLIKDSAPGLDMILGLDIAPHMIERAFEENLDPQIKFSLIGADLPVASSTADLIVSAHVLEEITSAEALTRLFQEVFRTLKEGGRFIILTANPEAVRNNAEYKTYKYETSSPIIRDGDTVNCTILGENPILISDTFWSHGLIKRLLLECGFSIDSIKSPQPKKDPSNPWKDELLIAPDNVWVCYKITQ